MPDLLVKLLRLPPLDASLDEVKRARITIRRAQPFEMSKVREFVEKNFSVAWADEISVGFANKPVSVYLAVLEKEIVGFAAYECTRRGFFGPTGVIERVQGRGIGKALLLACLWGLREMGYVYGIIGRAGPIALYQKTLCAIESPGSVPGICANLLK